MYRHLNENSILVEEQFGFREKSSTDLATYALLNTVLSSLNKKHFVGGIFCDLQKVFDCVNHNILLTKLEFYGVSGIANQLMRSYLNYRYQRVVIKDKMTIKYINDLSRTVNKVAELILFADDTSIVISNSSIEEFKSSTN